MDKFVIKFFGGNKRKLLLVIVLMGNFVVLVFDELSSFMDVVVKRKMWKVFSYIVFVFGRLLLLIMYSMEEVDVLVMRVVILVGGKLFVLGMMEELRWEYSDSVCV